MDIQSPLKTIQFIRGGEVVALANVPPSRTLLEVLREDLGCTGTKEGCGEGDCGACTVVVGEAEGGRIRYRAVNSCIKLAHSIDGQVLWTVEDIAPTLVASRAFGDALPLAQDKGALRLRPGPSAGSGQAKAGSAAPAGEGKGVDSPLHPAQQAMVNCHASQCGFCTPGFVMSLFGMYQNHVCQGQAITRELAQQDLSGNLCRCTGYRPIFDAAQQMAALPAVPVDEANLLSRLKLLAPGTTGPEADLTYNAPRTLAQLLAARAAHPDAQLVAGCTDVGLWVTKMHMQLGQVLDVTRVEELRRVERYEHHVAIGAAVTLSDAFAALVADWPQLQAFANRFAGLPVRNAGTLGGNVANGSPIGDSMPLLIALGANVVLMSLRGHRELPLEQLYTGYRKNVMAADEVLAWIKVPRPGSPVLQTAARAEPGLLHAVQVRAGAPGAAAFSPNPLPAGEGEKPGAPAPSPLGGEGRGEGQELLRVYKISKRYDDDISAVCLALNLQISDGKVVKASIGAGGVAATPVRAVQTEAALTGQPWTPQTVQRAMTVLRAEFSPISDMRASGAYRSEVLGNLLQRFWLESQGLQQINLESFALVEASS